MGHSMIQRVDNLMKERANDCWPFPTKQTKKPKFKMTEGDYSAIIHRLTALENEVAELHMREAEWTERASKILERMNRTIDSQKY